jgi:hypothetical protein
MSTSDINPTERHHELQKLVCRIFAGIFTTVLSFGPAPVGAQNLQGEVDCTDSGPQPRQQFHVQTEGRIPRPVQRLDINVQDFQRPVQTVVNQPTFKPNLPQAQLDALVRAQNEAESAAIQARTGCRPSSPINVLNEGPSLASRPISGTTNGGQDEYWLDWTAWRARITDTIWSPLVGTTIYGQTRVDYDVTRDHRIHITNVYTPDPSGESGQLLADRIMQLDGAPIWEFPQGSQQMVHHNWNKNFGSPIPQTLGNKIYLPGGVEHITRQW